jgi:hypothetical protein
LHFLPQRISIRLNAVQQTGVGIVRWAIRFGFRMRASGFRIAEHFLRRNQKVYVIKFITLWSVHAPKFTRSFTTA